jgi:hypothetical protein
MRLVDFGQKEDYQPLERGDSFPQFYENGDRYEWHIPMCWNYRFWLRGVCSMEMSRNTFEPMWLMGGEL